MKAKVILISMLAITGLMAFGQRLNLELTFTAIDSATYVQLDSIKIMNRTEGGDTVLYWPDTVLFVYQVGIPEISKGKNAFHVFQNHPNPVADQTTISLFVPEKNEVSMIITDMSGRIILKSDRLLDKGIHTFRFVPGGSNLYFFTAHWKSNSSSIKILQASSYSTSVCSLEYLGSEISSQQFKASEGIQSFSYALGNELLYIGYANGLESGILDSPEVNETYTFQFATNIPCPGMPTVTYEGQVYNTIQIFSQCWLKENLNVGTMIDWTIEQSDNGTIEKYCYWNEPDSCIKYGGLYQWREMMQYTSQQRTQGICPPGLHLPTDEEWKTLEGAVDSQYGIGDPVWEYNYYWDRGYDAGTNLKTTSGWSYGGNGTDLFGFSCLPGGHFVNYFSFVGMEGYLWTSTEVDSTYAFMRLFSCYCAGVYDKFYNKGEGFSVRCIRDN